MKELAYLFKPETMFAKKNNIYLLLQSMYNLIPSSFMKMRICARNRLSPTQVVSPEGLKACVVC